jgi:hypothetical protein
MLKKDQRSGNIPKNTAWISTSLPQRKPAMLKHSFLNLNFISMPANIVTTEDLMDFKLELLDEIKSLMGNSDNDKEYLKSAEVINMLQISQSTLQTLRINGTLPYTKIGGIIYYSKAEILRVLDENTIHHK